MLIVVIVAMSRRTQEADAASLATTAFDWDGYYAAQAGRNGGNGTGGIRGNPSRQVRHSTVRLYNYGSAGRGGTGNKKPSGRSKAQTVPAVNSTAPLGSADYNGEPAIATVSFGSAVTDSSAPRRSPNSDSSPHSGGGLAKFMHKLTRS